MSSRMVTTFVMSAQLLCKLFCERNLLQLVAYLHIKQIIGRRKCLKFVRPNIGRRGEVGYGGGCGVYALFVSLSSLERRGEVGYGGGRGVYVLFVCVYHRQ